MAQTGCPVGTEVLELCLSGRTQTETVPRLPPWWKSKRPRTRKLTYAYADSSH